MLAVLIGAGLTQVLRGEDESNADPFVQTYSADSVPTGTTSGVTEPVKQVEPLIKSGGRKAFRSLTSDLSGTNGIAVAQIRGSQIAGLGSLRTGHAWSTMKVPVLVTLMRDYAESGKGLSSSEMADAEAALTRSDNDAAKALFQKLVDRHDGVAGASAEIDKTLRAAGDNRTEVNTTDPGNGFTTFGQTIWSTGASVKFFRALANKCLMSGTDTKYVIDLMQNVASDQQWGAGSAGFDDSVALKGGWGPEDGGGYLVRQDAIIGSGSRGMLIAMIALPGSTGDSFATGQQSLTRMAEWAAKYVNQSGGEEFNCPA